MTAGSGPATDIAAITRDCLGAPMVDTIREKLVLSGPPIRSEEAPEHLLMILFASRAGSTFAGQLLAKTAHFNRVGEFFNIRQLHRMRDMHGLADDRQSLRWMIGQFGTAHAFGAKCGIPGFAGALATGFLEATFPRLQLILLDRRDRVAQAVSLVRAEQGRRFHAMQDARDRVSVADYDREAIAEKLAIIDHVYRVFGELIARTGKPCVTYWYEDIAEDPEGFVNAVCDGMKLARPEAFDPEVRATKLADGINEDWIARFRAGR